ncbi:MAG TPA: VWA domain-containing protein [Gammaproteobacteria bacterium]|nr:VWA domain-containing protein [Gammaproteobacteria bacterium]
MYKTSSSLIIFMIISIIGFSPITANASIFHVERDKPKIQLAILLDTSSSMSGLIDQARNQLWQIVNEFSKASRHGVKPTLEVAVYEYGNNRLSERSGYIRRVTGLTSELDEVSEALFSLTTSGGSEYCGYVIKTAVKQLRWSNSDNDIKAIFIAGNEPFTQGPVYFGEAISLAKNKGIVVNTIHAGNVYQGASTGWKEGALLAGGEYMSIDHNYQISHYKAPQDDRIYILNQQLNQTYIPYGSLGKKKYERQRMQDMKSKSISSGLMSKRARAKASAMYDNSKWDLVDAVSKNKVNIDKLKENELPEELQKMTKEKRKQYVKKKIEARIKLKKEIIELTEKRNKYITEKRKNAVKPSIATMNEAVTSAVRKQGKSKDYTFTK